MTTYQADSDNIGKTIMYDMEEIKKEIEMQNYEKAISLLKKIKINSYNSDEIYFHLIKSYFYLNNFIPAKSYLKKTIKSKDKNIKNYSIYYLAKIYIEQKKYIKALNLLIKTKNLEIQNELKKIFNFIISEVKSYNQKGEYNKTIYLYNKYYKLFRFMKDNLFLKNIFLNEYELASKKFFLKSKPRFLLVILSNLCNLKCIMCNQEKKIIKHLNKNVLYKYILKNLVYFEKIIWQGGETLILPYIKDILMETTKYPKLNQTIITNFQSVSDEILDLIIKNNINLIISIDGATKKTYEKIRKGASFETLIKNINRYNFLKKDNPNLNSFLQINFVVLKENYKEMLDIVEFAHIYNFKMIAFIQEQYPPKYNRISQITVEEKKHILKTLPMVMKKAKEYNIIIDNQLDMDLLQKDTNIKNLNLKNNNLNKKQFYCHLPWYKLEISYENIVRCDSLCIYEKEEKINKINFKNIWNSKTLVNLRKKITKNNIGNCNPVCKYIKFDYKHPIQF